MHPDMFYSLLWLKKSMARCIASIERHPVSTVFTFSMLIKPCFV